MEMQQQTKHRSVSKAVVSAGAGGPAVAMGCCVAFAYMLLTARGWHVADMNYIMRCAGKMSFSKNPDGHHSIRKQTLKQHV